jgi:phage shock protein E
MQLMQRISCAEVQEMMGAGGQLVDVRSPMEFYRGALPGAVNLPVQAIQRAPEILDRNRPVLVYCRSGARSAQARMWLQAMGFERVLDLGTPMPFLQCMEAATEDPAAQVA